MIRPANQRERAGLCLGILFGQIGGRGNRVQRRRLADGEHMHVGAQMGAIVDQPQGIIFYVELAGADRDVPRALCQSGDVQSASGIKA